MDDDSKESKPYYLTTCLVCYQNSKELFQLWLTDSEEITLLEKLQSISQMKSWVSQDMLLCQSCLGELNNAFQFKTKVLAAQKYWKNAACSSQTRKVTTDIPQSIISSQSDEVNEMSIYSENQEAVEVEVALLQFYTCEICNISFVDGNEFATHDCNDMPTDIKFAEDIELDTASQLKHISDTKSNYDISIKNGNNSSKVRGFSCNLCNKSFKQRGGLKVHLQSHSSEKKYSCEICSRTFQFHSSQRRHMRIHNRSFGEKAKHTSFLCTVCGKSFPYRNGLQRHMRIHTGEKNYECNNCDKKFAQLTHLQVHLRTHTGEKPYMCNYCGLSFISNAAIVTSPMSKHRLFTCPSRLRSF